MISRILIVDDYEPWRRHISLALRDASRWEVIGEASDGPEGLEKARALKPDLTLLDISLPTLDGFQVARRLFAEDPTARVLFVSEHQSWEIAKAALDMGARGYLVKSDAGRELLPALQTIARGRRFISSALARHPLQPAHEDTPGARHEVAFYSEEASLLEDYARVAERALRGGSIFTIVAGDARCEKLYRRLQARGLDIDGAIAQGKYRSMNVAEVLASFMVEGRPDDARFRKVAAAIIREAVDGSARKRPRVVVCGECAPTLLGKGQADAAIRVEQLCHEFLKSRDVDVFCGYLLNEPDREEDAGIFESISAAHSASYSR